MPWMQERQSALYRDVAQVMRQAIHRRANRSDNSLARSTRPVNWLVMKRAGRDSHGADQTSKQISILSIILEPGDWLGKASLSDMVQFLSSGTLNLNSIDQSADQTNKEIPQRPREAAGMQTDALLAVGQRTSIIHHILIPRSSTSNKLHNGDSCQAIDRRRNEYLGV